MHVHPRHARGCAWGRATCWRMWQGEPWGLSIDAHTVATPGWDERLIQQAERVGPQRGILTSPWLTTRLPGGHHPPARRVSGNGPPGTRAPRLDPLPGGQLPLDQLPRERRARARVAHLGRTELLSQHLFDAIHWPAWVMSSLVKEAWFTASAVDAGYTIWNPEGLSLLHAEVMRKGKPTGNSQYWTDGGRCTEDFGMNRARAYFTARRARGAPGYEHEGYQGYKQPE